MLFNIAALQSSVASSQQLDTDEGLKLAIKLLQQSAGIFQYLKGATPAAVPSEPTPDLSQDTLIVLQALMVAQAQEVFILKAIKGEITPTDKHNSLLTNSTFRRQHEGTNHSQAVLSG